MMINEFKKQNIKDEEFQSLLGLIHPSVLAYNFVIGAKQMITLDLVMKLHRNETVVTPYLVEYIELKEKVLGKSRILFSNEERTETLKELEQLYHTLKERGILY